ncbi:MAG: hypothetical protein IID18_03465, partial [Nitrospinae bacterium]|nr:hypothetical protein [Nitrospinota bacterium]
RHVLQTAKENHERETAWLTLNSILGAAAIQDLFLPADDQQWTYDFLSMRVFGEYLPEHAAEMQKVTDKVTDTRDAEFLRQLAHWLIGMRENPHYIFSFSLSEKGNLLSQWRAYANKGVALGFPREELTHVSPHYSLLDCQYYDLDEESEDYYKNLDKIDELQGCIELACKRSEESKSLSLDHWLDAFSSIKATSIFSLFFA